jgi:hypothetical protein
MFRLLKAKIAMPIALGNIDFVTKASGKHDVTNSHKTMATVVLRKGKSRNDVYDVIQSFFMADIVRNLGCLFIRHCSKPWILLIVCSNRREARQERKDHVVKGSSVETK